MLVGDPIARISRDQKFQIHFFSVFHLYDKTNFPVRNCLILFFISTGDPIARISRDQKFQIH